MQPGASSTDDIFSLKKHKQWNIKLNMAKWIMAILLKQTCLVSCGELHSHSFMYQIVHDVRT